MTRKSIVWSKRALSQFHHAITFISQESVANAEKVRLSVLAEIDKIPLVPGRFPPDKFKADNDGSYRAFELHRLRIVYRELSQEIRILRVRHTSMEPKEY